VTLTGRFFTAEEALAAGIINRVAPEGRHLEVAYELAAEVAKNPPLSVRATVRSPPLVYGSARARGLQCRPASLKLYLTEDFQEAARGVRRKTPARTFQGPAEPSRSRAVRHPAQSLGNPERTRLWETA
jgi:enoyl-CoA hydratase/carnithine racemase